MESFFYFRVITSIAFMIINFFGNTTTIVIFSKAKFRNQTMARYIIVESLCGFLSTIFLFLVFCGGYFNIWKVSPDTCKYVVLPKMFCNQVVSWMIGYCSLDRLLLVTYPNKFLFRKNIKFQILHIVGSVVFIFSCEVAFLLKYSVKSRGSNVCDFPDDVDVITFILSRIIFTLLGVIIPFGTMIVCTILIIYVLSKSKANALSKMRDTKKNELAKSLVFMDIFYLLCNAPSIFFTILPVEENQVETLLVRDILLVLIDVYPTFSCLLWIKVNHIYRQEFLSIFKCK